ncbi:MFS transporter [Microbacterium sp. A588]
MTTTTPPHRLTRNGRYITWLISDTAKGLASALFGFAIPLIVLFVTNDPAQAGIIGAVGMATRTITTLYGGVLADRHRRIVMMVLGSLIGVVLSGAFVLLALGDALTFTTLLVIDVLLAARTGLFDVAGESALKEIVPDDAMGRAQAANQGRSAVLELAGGPLGGALLAAGAWLIGAAMALCHVIAAVTAWMLQRTASTSPVKNPDDPDAGKPRADAGKPNAVREMKEGFRWLFSRPDLRGVLFVATIVNLGFATAMTTIIYALQQAGHSTITIGFLGTAAGVAMLLGALVAPALVSRVRASVIIIGGLSVSVCAVFGMIPAREPLALAGVLAITVFFIPAVNSALMGYFMVATPTALLGRANSASAVLGMGAMPLAPLIAGFGLASIGREGTLITASALCALSVLLALSNRGLRALPVESGWRAHARQFETT